jgi:hypothetical protein
MKQFIAALLSLTVTTQAYARSIIVPKPMQIAAIEAFHIQPDTDLAKINLIGGHVLINPYEAELSLTLYPAFHCPDGAMCAMMMPAPVIFPASIRSVQQGSCKEMVYTASNNLKIDGFSYHITVIDNRTNTCVYNRAVPATEIVLELDNETHRFDAGALLDQEL